MSSFGDNNIKTHIEEELTYWFKDYYGKPIYEATAEEKLEFITDVIQVLNYIFGEW